MEKLYHCARRVNGTSASPRILGRYNAFDWSTPTRIYFHENDFEDAFSDDSTNSSWMNGLSHLQGLNPKISDSYDLRNFNYAIAVLWGQNKDKIVDLFAYCDINRWPGNPTVHSFIFKNGVYQQENHEITCGDGTILIGLEEMHRRRCRNLSDFLQNPPAISGIVFY